MTLVATRLYEALAAKDYGEMSSCYASEARFTDPVFDLRGQEIAEMWRMLIKGSSDLVVTYELIDATANAALVDWRAQYTFPPTGRMVHNEIQARLNLRDGLITEHRDLFDFYRWSRQAFGSVGLAFGWTPAFRSRVRSRARSGLQRSTG